MKARHELKVFASAMEHKLTLNDHKGGWEERSFPYLFARLRDEVNELEQALNEGDWMAILFEAADVANYAMMIAWNALRGVSRDPTDTQRPDVYGRYGSDEVAHDRDNSSAELGRAPMERHDVGGYAPLSMEARLRNWGFPSDGGSDP